MRQCAQYDAKSCCKWSETPHVQDWLLYMSTSLQLIHNDVCEASLERLACGQLCSPDQSSFVDNISKTYRVCSSYCDQIFDSCRGITHIPTNKSVEVAFSNAISFCTSKNFTIDGFRANIVSGTTNCFNGVYSQVCGYKSVAFGRGLYSGIAGYQYQFTIQAWDNLNPKIVGGDSVFVNPTPPISNSIVRDNADGTYSAFFNPNGTSYQFNVNIGGTPIVGNPFTVSFESKTCPLNNQVPSKVFKIKSSHYQKI